VTEQRTTPEQRAALRTRYTPEPVPTCRVCGGPLSPVASGGGRPTVWACSILEADPDEPGRLRARPGRGGDDEIRRGGHFLESRIDWLRDGDADVLAAVDDADALAGALAEVRRLRTALAWYADRTNWRSDWMGPPPNAWQDRGDRARAALAPQSGAGPEPGQKRAESGLYDPQGPKSTNGPDATIAGATGDFGAKTQGGR